MSTWPMFAFSIRFSACKMVLSEERRVLSNLELILVTQCTIYIGFIHEVQHGEGMTMEADNLSFAHNDNCGTRTLW